MVGFTLIAIVIFFIWIIALRYADKIGNAIFKYIVDPILNIFK